MEKKISSMIRVRMSQKDAHYGGNLIDGAHIIHLFGDVATEIVIIIDGDEGLCLRYDEIEFSAPTFAGDFIEAAGEVTRIGNTSRHIEFVAKKVIAARPDIGPNACDVLEEPVIVCTARGVAVVPKEFQRKSPSL